MSNYDRWKTTEPEPQEEDMEYDKDEMYEQLDFMRGQDAQAQDLPKS